MFSQKNNRLSVFCCYLRL